MCRLVKLVLFACMSPSTEPGILLMQHSMRAHPQITVSLLDFLCRVSLEKTNVYTYTYKANKAGPNLFCCCSDLPVQFAFLPTKNLMHMCDDDPLPTTTDIDLLCQMHFRWLLTTTLVVIRLWRLE